MNEIKNTLEGANSRIMEAEDRISKVEGRMVEINEAERKKEKRIKRNEHNLRDLWGNVKCPNIRIMEKAMAPHSSTLAWKIPWIEEPGGLQFMGSLRVGHD